MKSKSLLILAIVFYIIGLACYQYSLFFTLVFLAIALLCLYYAFIPNLKWFKKLSVSEKEKFMQLDNNLKTLNFKIYKSMGSIINIKNIRYPKIYQLLENLSQNEDVLYFSFGTIQSEKSYIYVTNKKIILNSSSSRSIQYEKINTLENGKNWIKIITNSESIQITKINPDDVKLLSKNIRDTLELHKSIDINITKTVEKDVADKIIELNGGKPVNAVFVVGGGGKIPGYTDKVADCLGIPHQRVAVRGEEVLTTVDFEVPDFKKDSLYVTPVGICTNTL